AAYLTARGLKCGLHLSQALVRGMPEIDTEENRAGNGIARIWRDLQQTDGADAGRMIQRDAVHGIDDPRRTQHGIPAAVHRRRAGMALAAGNGHLEPADPLDALHHADGLPLGLEDWSLLDMRLEERAKRPAANRLVAGIADALQLLADGLAIQIGTAEAVFLGE